MLAAVVVVKVAPQEVVVQVVLVAVETGQQRERLAV
jgi:hypothetical protein